MSNRNKIHSKGRIQGQWTAARWEILDSDAWKQMSMGARVLYIALLKPLSFNADNNGKIFLSTRKAAKELGANQGSICIWFRELEHFGFIVMTQPGTIGPKGNATKWRITDVGWGTLDGKSIEPTKDYLKWSGEVFERTRPKTEKRLTKPLKVNEQTTHGVERANHSPDTPSERADHSYTKPPDRSPNHSYLDSTIPSAPLRPDKPKLVWSTPTLTEMPYTPELRRLYLAAEALNAPVGSELELAA